jgi:hypothetical protein
MTEEDIIKLIRSQTPEQTVFQLTQIKTFVDNSLKEVICKSFEKEEDKIKYLIDTLQNIGDFTISVTNEKAVRNNLANQFVEANHKAKLGNELEQQEKNQSQNLEENQASDQLS